MARRRIPEVSTSDKSNAAIVVTQVDARSLITIGPDSKLWAGKAGSDPCSYKHAIVRLIPPTDATDVRIDQLRSLMESEGAVAVKVLPRSQIGKVAAPESLADECQLKSELGVRDAVMKVAMKMASADKAGLIAELNSAMDEVGL